MSTDQHINESILNDEIREHQKENRTDHMAYLPDMENIGSEMLDQVLAETAAYDYDAFTADDVRHALRQERKSLRDFQALLSPAALPFLEEIAQQAQAETQKYFGNSVSMFTPVYIANYCENYCIYCGFNCHNHIRRAQLNTEEIRREFAAIAKTGCRGSDSDGRKPEEIYSGIYRGGCKNCPNFPASVGSISHEFG